MKISTSVLKFQINNKEILNINMIISHKMITDKLIKCSDFNLH